MRTRHSSPAVVLAVIAVVVALCGTSLAGYAAGKSSGDTIIKKKSLSGNRLKADTVTGSQVDESSLGKVSAASTADQATTATTAGTATNAAHASTADTTPSGVRNLLAYGPGWSTESSFGSRTAGFRKDASGYVHLEGAVARTSGTGTSIATLPPGFRPSNYANFAVVTLGSVGTLSVNATGDLHFDSGSTTFVSLEGITFHADQ